MTCYTVEVYKADKRVKRTGKRLITKLDYEKTERPLLEDQIKERFPEKSGYTFVVHETYVTRKNYMSGKEYQERYDTPYYCSPSSESYWSM